MDSIEIFLKEQPVPTQKPDIDSAVTSDVADTLQRESTRKQDNGNVPREKVNGPFTKKRLLCGLALFTAMIGALAVIATRSGRKDQSSVSANMNMSSVSDHLEDSISSESSTSTTTTSSGTSSKSSKSTKVSKSSKTTKRSKASRTPPSVPDQTPTKIPTVFPDQIPTKNPTVSPFHSSSVPPTLSPSRNPTESPYQIPTKGPTVSPSSSSPSPSLQPSSQCRGDNLVTLVSAPICPGNATCLITNDYGVQDTCRHNMDLSLELRVSPGRTSEMYLRALRRWNRLVVGDLSSVQSADLPNSNQCLNDLPFRVDDLYICGRDIRIDGQGGILGRSGPQYIRQDPGTGRVTAINGIMEFDIDDIPLYLDNGSLESVILHQMGHVYGIGTLWDNNGIVGPDNIYLGRNGNRVWQNDWGCVGSRNPPLDDGGAHWLESCFNREFMTGAIDSDFNAISILTIASLEDIGYEVNYTAADPYDGSNTGGGCCLPSITVEIVQNHPTLSEAGRAAAIAYGQEELRKSQLTGDTMQYMQEESDVLYIGDLFTAVLYQEDGWIHEVKVARDQGMALDLGP